MDLYYLLQSFQQFSFLYEGVGVFGRVSKSSTVTYEL